MRKTFLMLLATIIFAALPVCAQRYGGGGSSPHVSGGGSASHASSGGSSHVSGGSHASGSFHGGTHSSVSIHAQRMAVRESRIHFRGGRFDRVYFAGHWGRHHPFY